MLSGILSSLLYFVTDCDGTLCHYPSIHGRNETTEPFLSSGQVISLPASAGSGVVALTSDRILNLLREIRDSSTAVVCASGMRRSTALQRLPYFSSIDWWILENGGLVFKRGEGNSLIEVREWREMTHTAQGEQDMKSFAALASSEGYKVDASYETMLRVKGRDLQALLPHIPLTLEYTFNLGHLDIMFANTGKLRAIHWLLSHLSSQGNMAKDGHTDSERFIFMGDDDNDVGAMLAAERGFVAMPCSNAMQVAVDEAMRRPGYAGGIYKASKDGILGSEELLELILSLANAAKNAVRNEI